MRDYILDHGYVSLLSDNHHSINAYYVVKNEKLEDISEDIQQQITQLHFVGGYDNPEVITSLNFSFYQLNQLQHLSIGNFGLLKCKEVAFHCK